VEPTSNQAPNGISISLYIKIVIATGGHNFCLLETGSPSLKTVTGVVSSGVLESIVMFSFSCWYLF
jgi:hypothetical protein